MAPKTQRALEAFRRLLADAANDGGQTRVDALVALSQRTLFVATWSEKADDFRTLVNSDGQNALPVFTDEAQLMEAATRFGWTSPDGKVPFQEAGARKVFQHLVAHELEFLVVDIVADHSLEAERSEIEPLLRVRGRSDSSGPFAAVGRISSTMLEAVKARPPSSTGSARPPSSPGTVRPAVDDESGPTIPDPAPGESSVAEGAVAEPVVKAPVEPGAGSIQVTDAPVETPVAEKPKTFGGKREGEVKVLDVGEEPSDELLDGLTNFLREFPEVEWAAYLRATRGQTEPMPTIGVRMDASFRNRLEEIDRGLREAAREHGAEVDILLLDDPAVMRAVRANSVSFFPWRRRATKSS